MSSKHYDIAIIGGSLSARIAAALFAKQGSKVLFLRYREATGPAWFPSSLFLEKLLGTLGGRSCFVAQQPIQVLSRKARVTLNNDVPLENELSREFGQKGPAVSEWLEKLREQGESLEALLWENGGLPWPSLKTAAHFKLLCLRRKTNLTELDAPIEKSFAKLPGCAVEFIVDLLQGLSLRKISDLSQARAALLWAQAMRPENLKEPDFSELLSKRFDQFHGMKVQLEDLERIDFDGSRWTGGQSKSGGHFTATTFLLGDTRWLDRFKPERSATLPLPQFLMKRTTSDLSGQLSPLLASRVICGGAVPVRLAIEKKEHQLIGQVLNAGPMSEKQLREQIEPTLPFADYELSDADETLLPESCSGKEPQLLPIGNLPLRIGSNLYCADSCSLLPEMGAAGAAMLGWTLAENLARKHKQGKS